MPDNPSENRPSRPKYHGSLLILEYDVPSLKECAEQKALDLEQQLGVPVIALSSGYRLRTDGLRG